MEQYGWKFILDGVDISSKVGSFTITSSLASFCRELTFDITDETLYDTFDFSIIPEEPRVEVFTRIIELDEYDYEDEYDPAWISQGVFFIERPTFQVGVQETSTGVWGRQSTAVLGEPFAQKISKLWDSNTSVHAIIQEILELVGLTWDASKCNITDFAVYADTFEADNQYPIEVLNSLLELIVGIEGFITSDRLGNIWVKRMDRSPSGSDYNVTDILIQSINEEPEWPEFGNRIKVSPAESVSQDSVEIMGTKECIGTGAAASIEVYAQVKNGEGVPINNAVVDWLFDPLIPRNVWYKYPLPGNLKTASQNTGRILISHETQKATGFNSLTTAFEIDELVGVWAYADKTRATNFAPIGDYVLDGKNIVILGDGFTYCDQTVVVSYYAAGMVKNIVVYEPVDEYEEEPVGVEDVLGTLLVIASVSGREATKSIYVDNPCKCTTSLTVEVIYPAGSSIRVGQTAKIVASVENSGEPVSASVSMAETTGNGVLSWASRMTGEVLVSGETTEVVNDIVGQSQCMISGVPTSVTGVWRIDETAKNRLVADQRTLAMIKISYPDSSEIPYWETRIDNDQIAYEAAQANPTATGDNLYSEVSGTTIDLNVYVPTGTSLVAIYYKSGSVENTLRGVKVGTAKVVVSLNVSLEKGLSQVVDVTVSETSTETGGTGGTGGTDSGDIYTVEGPGILNWYSDGWWNSVFNWIYPVSLSSGTNEEVWRCDLGQWSVVRNRNGVNTKVSCVRGISCSTFIASLGSTSYVIGKNPGSITITLDYTDTGGLVGGTVSTVAGRLTLNVVINPG